MSIDVPAARKQKLTEFEKAESEKNFAPPPLARISRTGMLSCAISSSESRSPKVTPSMTDRVRWARVWRATQPCAA